LLVSNFYSRSRTSARYRAT